MDTAREVAAMEQDKNTKEKFSYIIFLISNYILLLRYDFVLSLRSTDASISTLKYEEKHPRSTFYVN